MRRSSSPPTNREIPPITPPSPLPPRRQRAVDAVRDRVVHAPDRADPSAQRVEHAPEIAVWIPWTVLVSALSAYSAARSPSAFSSPSGIGWQSNAMAGYSGTPLPKKLGIKDGRPRRVRARAGGVPRHAWRSARRRHRPDPRERPAERIRAPRSTSSSPSSPAGAEFERPPAEADGGRRRGRRPLDLLAEGVLRHADRHHRGRRPRRRRRGGLVDNKVCAIDEVWSGLPGRSTAGPIELRSPQPGRPRLDALGASVFGVDASRIPARLAAAAFRPAAGTISSLPPGPWVAGCCRRTRSGLPGSGTSRARCPRRRSIPRAC